MSVELKEIKWCRMLGIEKMSIECCWMEKKTSIVNGLINYLGELENINSF